MWHIVAKAGFSAMSLAPMETMRMSELWMLSRMKISCSNNPEARSLRVDASTARLSAVALSPRKWFSQNATSGFTSGFGCPLLSRVERYIEGMGTGRGSPKRPLDGIQYLLSKDESPARYMMGL